MVYDDQKIDHDYGVTQELQKRKIYFTKGIGMTITLLIDLIELDFGLALHSRSLSGLA